MSEPRVDPGRYIIRRLRMAHCSRGPERCKLCATLTEHKICLLDTSPPHQGEVQRPVIEVICDGIKTWREYDIVRSFGNDEEALDYARQTGITDVKLDAGDKHAQEC